MGYTPILTAEDCGQVNASLLLSQVREKFLNVKV